MTTTHVRATGAQGDIVEFDVDFEAGKIIGTPIGEGVGLAIGGMDVYQGEIHFPQQQSFEMPHPLTNPQSMAWYLMSRGYQAIEGELAKYPPPKFDAIPPGSLA